MNSEATCECCGKPVAECESEMIDILTHYQNDPCNVIDLSSVSDEDLNREYWRRAHRRAAASPGRPKKIRPCPKCGQQFSARDLAKHAQTCEYPTRFMIDAPTSTGGKVARNNSEFAEYVTAEGIRLGWSGGMPLPNIGATIDITMNNIGLAIVKGYFMEGGWLGVMTKPINPPKWLRENHATRALDPNTPQWSKDGIGCEFGAEIAAINAGRKK